MSVFSIGSEEQRLPAKTHDFEAILAKISTDASERDANPAFPEDPFVRLAPTGALAIPVPDPIGETGAPRLVRGGVACAAGGRRCRRVGRAPLRGPPQRRRADRGRRARAVAGGRAGRGGRWRAPAGGVGCRPGPGRGRARAARARGRRMGPPRGREDLLLGRRRVSTGRSSTGPPPEGGARRGSPTSSSPGTARWTRPGFAPAGMRASESHRVVFHGARVLALLGGPGELVRELRGSRATRCAPPRPGRGSPATAADAALADLGAPAGPWSSTTCVAHAAGRIVTARATIDRWLAHAAERADADPQAPLSMELDAPRAAVARACRAILDEAAAPAARARSPSGALDRASATSSSSRSSTGSTRWSPRGRPRGTGEDERGWTSSRGATRDEDPWGFATSPYEGGSTTGRSRPWATGVGRALELGARSGCSRSGSPTLRRAARGGRVGAAVAAARERLAGRRTGRAAHAPEEMPAGRSTSSSPPRSSTTSAWPRSSRRCDARARAGAGRQPARRPLA